LVEIILTVGAGAGAARRAAMSWSANVSSKITIESGSRI
jgi:hypothetical protein